MYQINLIVVRMAKYRHYRILTPQQINKIPCKV